MNEWTMTQSAIILDISDDEGKAKGKGDGLDRGKENVDPNEPSVPVTRSMAAAAAAKAEASKMEKDLNSMIDDEARTPLGDLNPTEFYAEGLNATSVILVHDDSDPTETETVKDEHEEREDDQWYNEETGKGSFSFESTVRDTLTSLVETMSTGHLCLSKISKIWRR